MEPWVAIIIAVIGSQAFVEFVKWLTTRKKPTPADRLLRALGQDRIVYVGSGCLEKGYITRDQLTIMTTIIEPYKEMGGDGLADSIMDRCRALPIRAKEEMRIDENSR